MTDPNTEKPDEKPIESPESPAAGAPPPAAAPEVEAETPPQEETVEPTVEFDAKTIEDGKAFAILSYALSFIGLPFFIVPLITRDNAYSLYHAKQALTIGLTGAVISAVSFVLSFICIGVITALVGGIFLLVLNIMGLMQTTKGEAKPLPVIGKYAVNWFKGVTVIEK